MHPLKPTVAITKKVLDFMMVDIAHADLTISFNYTITDSNSLVIRKGSFKGSMVQLRLSHVPDGNYQFTLYQNDILIAAISFEKASTAFSKQLL